jgi:hypothetical protein
MTDKDEAVSILCLNGRNKVLLDMATSLQVVEQEVLMGLSPPECGRCSTTQEHDLYKTLYGNCEHIPLSFNFTKGN